MTEPIDSTSRDSARRRLSILWGNLGMVLVFLILFIGATFFVPFFFNWENLKGVSLSVATVGIISCTMLFCLAAGDFDLSVGSIVAFAGVLAAVVTNYTGHTAIGIAAAILAGGAVGLFNGLVIAGVGINALITTLATMQIVRGLAYIVSNGEAVGVRETAFYQLGAQLFPKLGDWVPKGPFPAVDVEYQAHFPFVHWYFDVDHVTLALPLPIWILLICFIIYGLLLNRTIFGRNTLAIGGNAEAAHLAGVSVARTKIIIFTLQGMMSALAGVVLASRMTSGQPTTSQGLELQVISACVLGGVSLTGGIGTVGGMIVGVLIMGLVQNVMTLLNIPPFWQYVVSGAILLAAVMFDKLKQR